MNQTQKLYLRLIGYPLTLGILYICYYVPVSRGLRNGSLGNGDVPPGTGIGAAVETAVGADHHYLDTVPAACNSGRVELVDGQLVVHVSGSPMDMGTQYGTLLKTSILKMAEEYIHKSVVSEDQETLERLLKRIRVMRPSIPKWYLTELDACAAVVGVDPDLLLLAQAEGDILSLHRPEGAPDTPGSCSGYVVFGHKAINGGYLQVGRNFDYTAGAVVKQCAVVNYFLPAKGDGYSFASVGWTGILGGWTLVNSQGLVIANNLGGGVATNPKGIPTLIMSRMLAQKAGTIEEAIAILKRGPRMRGQIIWMGQAGDPATGRPDRAVAVEYDGNDVYTMEATDGVLIVTNRNQCFGGQRVEPIIFTEFTKYGKLNEAISSYTGSSSKRIVGASALDITLHSIEVFPNKGIMVVAHGTVPAQDGGYVTHKLPRP